jgi:ATP-dependent Clp protease protease subunit
MDIFLYDVIGDDFFGDGAATAKGLRDELLKADADEPITLRINSPGGDVMQAVAMLELLDSHAGEVTARIDGMAASAASFIAAACSKVTMAKGGLYMIHNPWSVVVGGADAMRREADVLDKVRVNLAGQYASRTDKLSLEEIEAAMAAETWYTAEEALAAGLVDEISGSGAKALAKIPKRLGFKNAPKELVAPPRRPAPAAARGGKQQSIAAWRQRIAATARRR